MLRSHLTTLCAWSLLATACASTQTPPEQKESEYAPVRASVSTRDSVETSLGTLRFFDGLPDASTVERVYDHLDFLRGVRAYLQTMPGASMMAMREGLYAAGVLPNYTVLISESLVDARSRFLTMDTETVYAMAWLSLKGGPMVVETPPRTIGVMVDAWQRHLADTGYPGPDRGRGGMYVVVPPGYAGYVPPSEFAVRSETIGVWVVIQGFLVEGKTEAAVANFQERLRIYPLKESARPPPNQFVDMSGMALDTIPPTGIRYFEAIGDLVQEEPRGSQDPELLGLLASIGIEKDRKFDPDPRMRSILEEAAAVGDATARVLVFANRDATTRLEPKSQWRRGAMLESDDFLSGGARELDARPSHRYFATAHLPRNVDELFGKRSEAATVHRDSEGEPLDGGRAYALSLPPGVPAKSYWSLVVYDNETRSMLQTDQRFPGINTAQSLVHDRAPPIAENDGSVTLYFGPEAPPGARRLQRRGGRTRGTNPNWIQTIPGKGWNAIFRLYGPQEAWYDGSWRPGEVRAIEGVASVSETLGREPRMATAPAQRARFPTRVKTRLGMLETSLGIPTDATAERIYGHLDLIRGVDVFLTMIPGASSSAIRRGLQRVGVDRSATVGIFERFVDPHALFLTAAPESIYALTWLDLEPGAMVVKTPEGGQGGVDDHFFRHITDLGSAGPDEGGGGLFLFTPPNYRGQISELYFAFGSRTFGNLLTWQRRPAETGPAPIVEAIRNQVEIYPYDIDFDQEFNFEPDAGAGGGGEAADDFRESKEDEVAFVDLSGVPLDTLHSNDFSYFEEIAALVRSEPEAAFDPDTLGLLDAVGIERGKPFQPDAKMRATLSEAAAIGNATVRAMVFRPRDPEAYLDEGSTWYEAFLGNSTKFLRNGARLLDARSTFYYLENDMSATMIGQRIGVGSRSVFAVTDDRGDYFRGALTYRVTLPANVPVEKRWSVTVYDPQTRSMLRTPGATIPAVSSSRESLVANADGSTTLYFGSRPPPGKEGNFIPTVPGKGWFAVLRLEGPLAPWFEGTWRPSDITRSR